MSELTTNLMELVGIKQMTKSQRIRISRSGRYFMTRYWLDQMMDW